MTILCGTDFSARAAEAAWVAAQLARRVSEPLHLVHALQFGVGELHEAAKREQREHAERQLREEAARLSELGARVYTHTLFGPADEALLQCMYDMQPRLLVLGAHGGPAGERRTDALLSSSRVPLLIVQNKEPFALWVSQGKPLRLVLGADASSSTDAALAFIHELRGFGPCAVSALHLFWPPQEFHRLGFGGVRSLDVVDPEVTQVLIEELRQRLPGVTQVEVEPHLGNSGQRVVQAAREQEADLVVVGSHGRSEQERLWHGSVSLDVLREARQSVACVPLTAADAVKAATSFRSILVATDGSDLGTYALSVGCAAVSAGAEVHVVHVIEPRDPASLAPSDIFVAEKSSSAESERARAMLEQQTRALSELMPQRRLRLHVLESRSPAEAIAQAAERLRVDVICMGTHGRSGLSRLTLGSVADEVVRLARRPVLLAKQSDRSRTGQ